jgi:exosortase F-associated protein
MRKIVRYPLVVLLLFLLVLIRAFEEELFYDPFILFFQNDFLYTSIPDFKYGRLIWNLFLRYSLNSIISMGVIYFAFEKIGFVILSSKLYIYGFLILAVVYSVLLFTSFDKGYLLPFYVRRFLIHPLFLLLLLAALYYEKLVGVKPVL